MNLGIVTKPNAKGQIVIPKRMRDALGIDENALLSLTIKGYGVYITPLEKSLGTSDSRNIAVEVLKKTMGTWKRDTWTKTEKQRRKLELAASAKRKQAW
ncbi:AbrB/MazE/SpoVT family DNA-binding domain-containing protein [Candidatus Gottesmanbacteria bacterium]|nr:AbrB/MazE/SpoVT family DNA-binding domain-containing protein [Candidatus Gottesmanbacteria bacterium]